MDMHATGAPPHLSYIKEHIEGVAVSRHPWASYVPGPPPGWQIQPPRVNGKVHHHNKYYAVKKHGGVLQALELANKAAEQIEAEYAAKGLLSGPYQPQQLRWTASERKLIVAALERELRRVGIEQGIGKARQFRAALTAAQERCLADGALATGRARETFYLTPTRQKHLIAELLKLQARLAAAEPKPEPPEPPKPPEPEPEEALDDEPTVIDTDFEPPPTDVFDYVGEHEKHREEPAPRQQFAEQFTQPEQTQSLIMQVAQQIGASLGDALGKAAGVALNAAIAAAIAQIVRITGDQSPQADDDDRTEEDRRIDERILRGDSPEQPPGRSESEHGPAEVLTPPTQPRPAPVSAMAEAMERASTSKIVNSARKNEPLPPPVGHRPARVLVCGLNPTQRQPLARKFNQALDVRFYDAGTGRDVLQDQVKRAEFVISTIKQGTGIAAAIMAVQKRQFPGDKTTRFLSFDAARVDNVDRALEQLALAGRLEVTHK